MIMAVGSPAICRYGTSLGKLTNTHQVCISVLSWSFELSCRCGMLGGLMSVRKTHSSNDSKCPLSSFCCRRRLVINSQICILYLPSVWSLDSPLSQGRSNQDIFRNSHLLQAYMSYYYCQSDPMKPHITVYLISLLLSCYFQQSLQWTEQLDILR